MNASLKGKLIAGFVLAFLAGGAAGIFFGFHQSRHGRADFGRHPNLLAEKMRHRLERQLDLTPAQMQKIAPILDRASKELQEIRAETGAKVRDVMAQTNRAIAPELTEAQKAQLAKLQKSGPNRKKGDRHHRRGARRGAAGGRGKDDSLPPSP